MQDLLTECVSLGVEIIILIEGFFFYADFVFQGTVPIRQRWKY